MKENPQKHKDNSTTREESIRGPELIMHCPKCGGEIGLWSEDEETTCIFCDHKVFEKETTEH